jgi:FAD/FMN-containing dehydrogenase
MARGGPQVAGWGGLAVPGRVRVGEDLAALTRGAVLTRGLGRSYGDSALPPSGVDSLPSSVLADCILGFDEATGWLWAEAGLSLAAVNRTFWPRRWSCPVLPGTQFVTLGGMVAADVHGKNHHVDGTIGRHVERLRLRLADDRLVECSREEHPDLFRATLGGMGLTGHILEVTLRLQPIPTPWIWRESERVDGLDAFLAGLAEAARRWPFTVGWLDALSAGAELGRGILYRGRWAESAEAPATPPAPLRERTVPFTLPSWVLNRLTMRTFNALYFRLHRRRRGSIVHPEQFFHPLDAIRHWNRVYGHRGFTQHQCVLPEAERPGATRRFLEDLTRLGGASFLCVIKDCGPEGEGLLSFPRPGISIAVDLPVRRGLQELIDALNERVVAEGGRIYLAKDGYTRREHFQAMENKRLPAFAQARRAWDAAGRLASAQSRRLLG